METDLRYSPKTEKFVIWRIVRQNVTNQKEQVRQTKTPQ